MQLFFEKLYTSTLYVALLLHILFCVSVHCNESDASNDATSTHELENIHSFFYMNEDNLSALQIRKNDQYFPTSQPSDFKESDERVTQEAIFYKRLISVLLSNLVMQRIDDKLIGVLNIEASLPQFEYLKNFVNGHGSMREVDKILESVIKQSAEHSVYHYMTETCYYLNELYDFLKQYLLIMREHWDITIIAFIIMSSFMILRRQRFSRGLIIFIMIDVIFVISFFITWWRLIQEAEIKLMVAQAQFAEMPIACQPHKMGIWDKMMASFWPTNDCEKYYETIMTNPRLQVTPAFALTHFLSTVIFHPLSYFGIVISEFIENATSKLNFVYKLPVTIGLYTSVCIGIVLLLCLLIGGSFNFGIGPFLKFGIGKRAKPFERQERIYRIYEDTSLENKLRNAEKMKEITSGNDLASGDAGINPHYLDEKCEKCIAKHNEEYEGDGDRL